MKKAIILHGLADKKEFYDASVPSASNHHWVPWLQKQLQVLDIDAQTPEIFQGYKLSWEDWVREVEKFDIDENTDVVGHSCGGGFWIRYLSENPHIKVGKVLLVAPWIDVEKEYSKTFFDFTIDSAIADRTKGITIFHSDNDVNPINTSLEVIRLNIPEVNVRVFHDYGHFILQSMNTIEFPELVEHLVG